VIIRGCLLSALFLITSVAACAGTIGLTFTGGSNTTTAANSTRGWAFIANQNISIVALGLWDINVADPLGEAHEVGLWTSAGSLLRSTLIPAIAPLTGGFRFIDLTVPVGLAAGDTYVIGAVFNTDADTYRTGVSSGNITTAPQITYLGGRDVFNTNGSLTFPTINSGTGRAFGPNILFEISAVPEPYSWNLFSTGLGAVIALRRRLQPMRLVKVRAAKPHPLIPLSHGVLAMHSSPAQGGRNIVAIIACPQRHSLISEGSNTRNPGAR
jgi:hypothetical protein